MATIRMNGGQTFDVAESYEVIQDLIAQNWTGTYPVTDRSTGVVFVVRVPSIAAVQP